MLALSVTLRTLTSIYVALCTRNRQKIGANLGQLTRLVQSWTALKGGRSHTNLSTKTIRFANFCTVCVCVHKILYVKHQFTVVRVPVHINAIPIANPSSTSCNHYEGKLFW